LLDSQDAAEVLVDVSARRAAQHLRFRRLGHNTVTTPLRL